MEEVVVVGRRGPLQAPFTTLELRELGDLEALGDVDIVVDPADFADITDDDLEAAGKTVRNNIKVLRGYAETHAQGRQTPHRVPLRHVADRDQGRRAGSSRSCSAATNSSPTPTGGWSPRTPASARSCPRSWWSARSVTAALPTPGLPFDERAGTIPHADGRIAGSRNEYVAGWIKRGPTGVIGTNKKDSQETVDTLLADLQHRRVGRLRRRARRSARGVVLERQPKLVTDDHWKLIDAHERTSGEGTGRPRVKLTSVADLLRIGHG